MPIYRDEKSNNWYISITVKGRRIRKSTGTADRQEAQQIHDQIKADLWKRKDSGETWHEACLEWLNHQPRGESDRYRVRVLITTIPDMPLYELTTSTFRFPGSPATYNRMANLVTAILNSAKHRGKLETVPKLERKKVTARRIRWLTEAEWVKLYAQLPPHLKPLARFSLATGLRQYNATHLEWSQVDLGRKVAWIHADQAKANEPIGIPLSDEAIAVLKGQIGLSDQWVFPYKGKPIGKIKGAWKKALHRAGIKNFRWHDLRHTWASWHVMSGTRLEVLMELGGWSDIDMVMKYAHLDPSHLAKYANNAKPYQVTDENYG